MTCHLARKWSSFENEWHKWSGRWSKTCSLKPQVGPLSSLRWHSNIRLLIIENCSCIVACGAWLTGLASIPYVMMMTHACSYCGQFLQISTSFWPCLSALRLDRVFRSLLSSQTFPFGSGISSQAWFKYSKLQACQFLEFSLTSKDRKIASISCTLKSARQVSGTLLHRRKRAVAAWFTLIELSPQSLAWCSSALRILVTRWLTYVQLWRAHNISGTRCSSLPFSCEECSKVSCHGYPNAKTVHKSVCWWLTFPHHAWCTTFHIIYTWSGCCFMRPF